MLFAAGLEDAFVGVVYRCGASKPIAAYDRDKCIEILMRDGGDRHDAEDHFQYNVVGSWVGNQKPIFIEKLTIQEAADLLKEDD